jgi:hypothetical protein
MGTTFFGARGRIGGSPKALSARVPEPLGGGADFKQHYAANHRWFFVLAVLLPPIDG